MVCFRWHSSPRVMPLPVPGLRKRLGTLHADEGHDFVRRRRYPGPRGIRVRMTRRGVEGSERLGRYRWVVWRARLPGPASEFVKQSTASGKAMWLRASSVICNQRCADQQHGRGGGTTNRQGGVSSTTGADAPQETCPTRKAVARCWNRPDWGPHGKTGHRDQCIPRATPDRRKHTHRQTI